MFASKTMTENGEREQSREENDQLAKSTKKMKQGGMGMTMLDAQYTEEADDMDLGSPRVAETIENIGEQSPNLQRTRTMVI